MRILILVFTVILVSACGEESVVLEGWKQVDLPVDEIEIADAFIEEYTPQNYGIRNFGDRPEFGAINGTASGTPFIVRSLISFDFDLPKDARIDEAKFSLYACPSAGFGDGHRNEGDNSAFLKRVTEPWQEMEVTWNTQPAFTEESKTTLSASSSFDQDYLDIDVKSLLEDHLDSSEENFSLILMSTSENPFSTLLFCSSDSENSEKRPVLNIKYSIPE